MFFEQATKRIGVITVNFYKLVFAILFLAIAGLVLGSGPLPLHAPGDAWLFLSLSGLIGFVISDIFLFSAYRMISSRITMLFLALSPPLTAGFEFLFLGARMGPLGLAGMALVAAGIILAVMGRREPGDRKPMSREDRKGYLYALLASSGQAIGMVFSRRGVMHVDAIAGTQIRVLTAIVGFGIVALLADRGRGLVKGVRDPKGMKMTLAGAFFGPFIGVTLSLFATQHTNAGVVSTLIGLSPILIIPPSILIFRHKVKAMELAGAVIAVAGSAVFFL